MYALPSRNHSRAHRRYPVELPVRFADNAQLARAGIVMYAGWTRDVSRKGVCITSEYTLAVGTELTLELGMDGTELVVMGRVVWCGVRGEFGIELSESEIDPSLFDWLIETGTGF